MSGQLQRRGSSRLANTGRLLAAPAGRVGGAGSRSDAAKGGSARGSGTEGGGKAHSRKSSITGRFNFKEGTLYKPQPRPPQKRARGLGKPAPKRPVLKPVATKSPASAPSLAPPASPVAIAAPQRPPSPVVSPPKAKQRPKIASLRAPRRFVPPSAKRAPLRGSLSSQLASIGASASAITDEINKRHGLESKEKPLFVAPSRSFVVGRVESKFPSPVQFFKTHCTYVFHHPLRKEQITMVMYYADMVDLTLSDRKQMLKFRVPHALDKFGDDYNPANWQHAVSIGFNSESDCKALRAAALPFMRSGGFAPAGSRGGAGRRR